MTIKGLTVQKVLVAPATDIASESYVGIIVDRGSQRPVLMVSDAGGIDIEEVARTTPERIYRLAIDPRYGLLPHQGLGLALRLYRDVGQARSAAAIMANLYAAFYAVGASLAEDRKSTRLNSSHSQISYAVFCLKKKTYDVIGHLVELYSNQSRVIRVARKPVRTSIHVYQMRFARATEKMRDPTTHLDSSSEQL